MLLAMRVVNLALLLIVLLMLLNLVGLFSFLDGYFNLLLIALAGFSLLIISTLVLRFVFRGNERVKKSLPGLGWPSLAFVFVIIMGASFPTSSRAVSMNNEKKCEDDLVKLGQSAEKYAAEKGRLPDTLEQLVKDNYLEYIPSIGKSAYVYRIDTDNGKSSFVLICPDPGKLLKARGFRPAKKCRDIRYIQGRGLVVETE